MLAASSLTSWLLSQEIHYGPKQPLAVALSQDGLSHKYYKIAFANTFNYYTILWTVKATFCCIFFELREHFSKTLYRVYLFIVVYLIAGYLVVILSLLLWCRPLHSVWADPLMGHWCNTQGQRIVILSFVFNVTTDLMVFTFAIVLIRQMQIRRGDTRAIVFILLIGLSSITASAVRFWLQITMGSTTDPQKLSDTEHASIVATELEVGCAQIASCLPSFRAIWRTWLESSRVATWSWKPRFQQSTQGTTVIEEEPSNVQWNVSQETSETVVMEDVKPFVSTTSSRIV